ncbi:uncharacterized protein LOC112272416 [Brachypodium distachyon]|uniref:uncharacterized protein LOC112272416 n=1 Tax=Brachypodium distachyon TaxID=15368 RepID=UPI0001C705A9|nr:uncharacterized protein LOC112272416 [Brachypodium distachyon]|eukprot:XP_024318884.1 uncharacterized protein LOC112272416 [Brachypodium distachyon]
MAVVATQMAVDMEAIQEATDLEAAAADHDLAMGDENVEEAEVGEGGESLVPETAILDLDFDADEEVQVIQRCVIEKYYSMRRVKAATLLLEFKRIWQTCADMKFKDLEDNMYVITFDAEGDYQHVVHGGPWQLRGEVLIVAPVDGTVPLMEIPVDAMPIWIHIDKVPPMLQNDQIGRALGSFLGRVLEVDAMANGQVGAYLRVRVEISLRQPLQDEVAIRIKGKLTTYKVQYERLPNLCFHCGLVGHGKTECLKEQQGAKSRGLDARLRCSPVRKADRRDGVIRADSAARRKLMLPFGAALSSNRSHASSRRMSQEQQSADEIVGEVELSNKVNELSVHDEGVHDDECTESPPPNHKGADK